MKNKIKALAYAASATALTVPAVAFGAWYTPTGTHNGGLSNRTVGAQLSLVLNWLLSIVGIGGVIGFVVAGIMYLTAAGDEKKIETAKTVMLYSIVGVVVAVVGLIAVRALAGLFITGDQNAF